MLGSLGGSWPLNSQAPGRLRSKATALRYRAGKRAFDFSLALIGFVVLLPLVCAVGVSIFLTSRGPILYRGVRSGRNGQPFEILKFRTMVCNAESIGGPSTALNDPRLISIGPWLRKYKLDELPQLVNVIMGDMSLVGPRPQVEFYTRQYTADMRRILDVRPGITDLASLYFSDMDSVLGADNPDAIYAEQVEPVKNILRLRYVDNVSFLLDLRILTETVGLLIGIKSITGLTLEP